MRAMHRIEHSIRVSILAYCLLVAANSIYAQSGTATLSGTVVDESNAVVPDVTVTVMARATGFQREKKTEREGQFSFAAMQPGKYTVRATRQGFTPVEVPDLTLNVGDNVSIRLKLTVEKVGEAVTVVAGTSRVNTSPAVGTVVDRQFVENLPLNGRTLQPLLELTPGVVLTRVTAGTSEGGQFSVNGQRANANYFTIDGASANTGIISAIGSLAGQSGSGSLPSMTALGTTNSLVSVDALQEFRIQTSTYAPEFGRTPGGQISMVTRSGTNQFHGSLFEYFRDDALDAADWFANRSGLPQARLSQNSFGGVVGGPILRNRTFFFASYEGLRLTQPQAREVNVASMELRRIANPAMRVLLNAQPLPNRADLGNGFALFAATYSDESRFDATSLKIDHNLGAHNIFARASYTPSYSEARDGVLSLITTTNQKNRSVTGGLTSVLTRRLVNDLRLNYTENAGPFTVSPDDFGGAVVPATGSIFTSWQSPENTLFTYQLVGAPAWRWGAGTNYTQRQINIVDGLTLVTKDHEWKAGVDYRRINPVFTEGETTSVVLALNVAGVASGTSINYRQTVRTAGRQAAAFDNLSLYLQDNWKLASRLTVTYGVRWELVPPPHSTEGKNAITLDRTTNLYGAPIAIAPSGTKLWDTRYNNVAPRIGASYVVSRRAGAQLIVKGGVGVFHDLGFGQIASSFLSFPFTNSKLLQGATLPLSEEALSRPGQLAFDSIAVSDRDLRLPYTIQWNVTAEQSLGEHQNVTIGYVGADGNRLLKRELYNLLLVEPPTQRIPVFMNRNGGFSDYRALQVQFQRRLNAGVQALTSYTFGRSRDTSSSDAFQSIPAEKLSESADFGASDYDVRHVFSAAATYQMGERKGGALPWRILARDWGVDLMVRARSGFPIGVSVSVPFPPDTQSARPNVVPGQPLWIEDPSAPGGRRLNRAAFVAPPADTQGDLKRGVVRGFGARQIDLAVRRSVQLPRQMRLQLRFEVFNVSNTPNFSDPSGSLVSSTFGVSTQMLNRGFGGVNPFYQIGGPRSVQLAAKFLF